MRESNEARGCQSCQQTRAERIQRGLDEVWQDEWLKDKWSLALILVTAVGLWIIFKLVRG